MKLIKTLTQNNILRNGSKLLLLAALLPLALSSSSSALSGSDWRAGRIIDDSVFRSSKTMTVQDIQNFLNSKMPSCDTWGEKPYAGTTRAEYGKSRGAPPPYTCLNKYYENVTTKENNLEGRAIPAGAKSAAQIIYDYAQQYNINPQVLIALLQKEQTLITDDWPWVIQYKTATGYGCPDFEPCDSDYYGFSNQVRWAARMYQAISDNDPNWFSPYFVGDNYIQWNPIASCSGTNVNIVNRATASLYSYTPYQPNQAALNNMYGTGDSCSSYGNRNFWRLFNEWFGSSYSSFTSFSDPRWMQLKSDVKKIDLRTGQEVDDLLLKGRHLHFTSKIMFNSEWCFRTEHDTRYKEQKCIPISSIEELVIVPTAVGLNEKHMEVNTYTQKRDLRRGKIVDGGLYPSRQIEMESKVTIGGTVYFITKSDATMSREKGIPATDLTSTATFSPMEPLALALTENTSKIRPAIGTSIDGLLPKGMVREYTSKVNINGVWYYRTEHDSRLLLSKGIPESKLTATFTHFSAPRWMQLKNTSSKVEPLSGRLVEGELLAKRHLRFVSKTFVNNKWYYRTEHDTINNIPYGVPASDVEEIPYEAMSSPREMMLTTDTSKVIPAQEKKVDQPNPKGMVRKYTTKIIINGTTYLRTESDTLNDYDKGINMANLRDS